MSYSEPIEYCAERPPEVNSLMALNITYAKVRIIGFLSVDSESSRVFDDDKDLMFKFSKVVSMLISNVELAQELQENLRVAQLTYG